MQQKFRTEIQLIFVLVLAAASMVALSLALGGATTSLAQGLPTSTPPQMVLTKEDLAAFGLADNNVVQAAGVTTFDLEVAKTANVTTVASGGLVTFTVTITNHGPYTASGIIFQDLMPKEMLTPTYTFAPGIDAVDNGATTASTQKWLILNSVPANNSVVITVTAQLTSTFNATVTNTAAVTTFMTYAESGPYANSGTKNVGITGSGSGYLVYLPYTSKYPTPTPTPTPVASLVYHEDFESGSPWYEFSSDGCTSDTTGGLYKVTVESSSRECLPFAPSGNANRAYGEFEVTGYISGDYEDSNHSYGIWLNGAGGDTQYVFRIYPNISGCSGGGKWDLRRKKDGNSSTLAYNNCDTNIKRGYGSSYKQTLKVAHKSDGTISLYIDGVQVGSTITDSSQLTGTSTGVYARAADHNIVAKFDDFKVYKY